MEKDLLSYRCSPLALDDSIDHVMSFKCTPEVFAELTERPASFPRFTSLATTGSRWYVSRPEKRRAEELDQEFLWLQVKTTGKLTAVG
jgi:hypothetical protein